METKEERAEAKEDEKKERVEDRAESKKQNEAWESINKERQERNLMAAEKQAEKVAKKSR